MKLLKYSLFFLCLLTTIIATEQKETHAQDNCSIKSISFSQATSKLLNGDFNATLDIKSSNCEKGINITLKSFNGAENYSGHRIDNMPRLLIPNKEGDLVIEVETDEAPCYDNNTDVWGYQCMTYIEAYDSEKKLLYSQKDKINLGTIINPLTPEDNIDKQTYNEKIQKQFEELLNIGILVGNCFGDCSRGDLFNTDKDNWDLEKIIKGEPITITSQQETECHETLKNKGSISFNGVSTASFIDSLIVELKINTTECISIPLEIEIIGFDHDRFSFNDWEYIDIETKDGTTDSLNIIPTDQEVSFIFKTGDEGCKVNNYPDCIIFVKINTDNESTNTITPGINDFIEEINNFTSGKDYKSKKYHEQGVIFLECGGTIINSESGACDLSGVDWILQKTSGSIEGNLTNAQNFGTTTPTYDQTSECFKQELNNNKGGYDENCYEFLAPIPGFASASGDVVTTADGRQFVKNLSGLKLGDYIQSLFNIALGILMVLSVIMIVFAGVEYMTVESIYGKSKAKGRITGAVTGLILALGIFLILETINPQLLQINFGSKIEEAKINVKDVDIIASRVKGKTTTSKIILNVPSFEDGLKKKIESTDNNFIKAYAAADSKKVPRCVADVILKRESAARIKAIGKDENVNNTPSRDAFLVSGKTYSGKTITSNTKNDSVFNENSNDLGLDWRFSQGIGLTQVTFFPDNYKSGAERNTYINSIKNNQDSFWNNKTKYPTRTIDGKTYTPKDMLDVQNNLEGGLSIWYEFYKSCKTIQGAFSAYITGSCNKDAHGGEGALRTTMYKSCVNN